MARCKECESYALCSSYNPKVNYSEDVTDVENKCEDFKPKEIWVKLSEVKKSKSSAAEYTGEWGKATEIEETTLKIKASAYDAIKEAMLEQMKMDYDVSDTFNIIDGVIRMEEAVTAAFVK